METTTPTPQPESAFQTPEVNVTSTTPTPPPIQPTAVPSEPTTPPKSSTGKKILIALLVVLILVVLSVAGYFLYKNSSTPEPTQIPTTESTPSPTADPTADWETFTSLQDKLSFKYPPNWTKDPLKQTPNVVVALDNPSGATLTLSYAPEGIDLNCDKSISENEFMLDQQPATRTVTQILANDDCGNTENRETIWINFEFSNIRYMFTYHYLGINDNLQRELFDQILSTFEFVNIADSQAVTGSIFVYHEDLKKITVSLSASSPVGTITSMKVWSDTQEEPEEWQPFTTLTDVAWGSENDTVYARFKDDLENVSNVYSDTDSPPQGPPPQ